MFLKHAKVVVSGKAFESLDAFSKTASKKLKVFANAKFTELLADVHEAYNISPNVSDYIFVVARAVTADVPNENRDGFSERELLDLKKSGSFCYESFIGCPMLEEHDDSDIKRIAGGFIVDAYYDDVDIKDRKVVALLAVDKNKKKKFATNILNGVTEAFSMGCICESTTCSKCGNIAKYESQYCDHIKAKYSPLNFNKEAFEWCNGVTFRELSHVENPADKTALSKGCCSTDNSGNVICKV